MDSQQIADELTALWDRPENHANGHVYRVRKEWRELAELLDRLVDIQAGFRNLDGAPW